MLIRQKNNKSGTVSIQIIDRSRGRYKTVKTIGTSMDPLKLDRLNAQAKVELLRLTQPLDINFNIDGEKELIDLFFKGIDKIRLVGPELIIGKLFDEIGFNCIKDELFRHLVITSLCYPASKVKTTDYLFKHKGIHVDAERIYRYMDKIPGRQKERIQEISNAHTLRIPGSAIGDAFYHLTTLGFEVEDQVDLRIAGFPIEGKHQNPQVLLGLLVSNDGYPLAYEILEGNKYESHTILQLIETFKKKHRLHNLVVVADVALPSNENDIGLPAKDYEYIIGTRLKSEKTVLQKQILALQLEDGQCGEIAIDQETRLILTFSEARAKKDKSNHQRGLVKLERAIKSGRLSHVNINNRGYNKYLKLKGKDHVSIDYKKFKDDNKWDGLKGYVTNTKLNKDQVIAQFENLGKIEKAFRISRTDLRIKPVFHRLRHRIEAHIGIAFCAYKIYKELERKLKFAGAKWTPEEAIDIANTIFEITITAPFSKNIESRLHLQNDEQFELLEIFKPS